VTRRGRAPPFVGSVARRDADDGRLLPTANHAPTPPLRVASVLARSSLLVAISLALAPRRLEFVALTPRHRDLSRAHPSSCRPLSRSPLVVSTSLALPPRLRDLASRSSLVCSRSTVALKAFGYKSTVYTKAKKEAIHLSRVHARSALAAVVSSLSFKTIKVCARFDGSTDRRWMIERHRSVDRNRSIDRLVDRN
jgi:hypothetical protein